MNESGKGQMNNRNGLENYGLKKQQILFGFIPIISSFPSSFLIFVFLFFYSTSLIFIFLTSSLAMRCARYEVCKKYIPINISCILMDMNYIVIEHPIGWLMCIRDTNILTKFQL